VTEAKIEFVGMEEIIKLLDSVIKELGTVGSAGISTMLAEGNHLHLINQAYSFKVILMDKKGNAISSETMRKSVKGLSVEVAGASEEVGGKPFSIKERNPFIFLEFEFLT